jgi:hypothetical protein
MRNLRAALLFLAGFVFLAAPMNASGGCGCTAARPCAAQTLETATLPATSVEQSLDFTVTHSGDLVGGFVLSFFLLPFLIALRHAFARRDALLIARLDRLSGAVTSPVIRTPAPTRMFTASPRSCPVVLAASPS